MQKTTILISTLLFVGQNALADETNHNEPAYSMGVGVSNFGLGLDVSGKTGWHLKTKDQLQWRATITGIEGTHNHYEHEIAGIEYKKLDYETTTFRAGMDWFPSNSGWSEKVFFSGGIMYMDLESTMHADNSKTYSVGSQVISPGDLDSFKAKVTRDKVIPYLSLGWGNKITKEPGFDFMAEFGVLWTGNADVELSSSGNTTISSSDLEAEKRGIIKDTEGPAPFANFSVSYHF